MSVWPAISSARSLARQNGPLPCLWAITKRARRCPAHCFRDGRCKAQAPRASSGISGPGQRRWSCRHLCVRPLVSGARIAAWTNGKMPSLRGPHSDSSRPAGRGRSVRNRPLDAIRPAGRLDGDARPRSARCLRYKSTPARRSGKGRVCAHRRRDELAPFRPRRRRCGSGARRHHRRHRCHERQLPGGRCARPDRSTAIQVSSHAVGAER